jgi:hypothetical protein
MKKDLRKIMEAARLRGWTVTKGTRHFILDHPHGGRVVVATSASDWRALANVRADIERVERAAA